MTSRPSARHANQMRDISITREFTKHAEGSVLIEFGETKVICTASVDARVPPFLKGQGSGWITAEYGMLPRATGSRALREAARGKQTGRTQEIQRLIGRSLRACVDLKKLGERTITLDCDVIQADGGTRTAAITGAYVALVDSINYLIGVQELKRSPVISQVASVSVGIYKEQVVLDLDYAEDSKAETDMNIVMNSAGEYIEIQGTAEGVAFTRDQMDTMLNFAHKGIDELVDLQNQALEL